MMWTTLLQVLGILAVLAIVGVVLVRPASGLAIVLAVGVVAAAIIVSWQDVEQFRHQRAVASASEQAIATAKAAALSIPHRARKRVRPSPTSRAMCASPGFSARDRRHADRALQPPARAMARQTRLTQTRNTSSGRQPEAGGAARGAPPASQRVAATPKSTQS